MHDIDHLSRLHLADSLEAMATEIRAAACKSASLPVNRDKAVDIITEYERAAKAVLHAEDADSARRYLGSKWGFPGDDECSACGAVPQYMEDGLYWCACGSSRLVHGSTR